MGSQKILRRKLYRGRWYVVWSEKEDGKSVTKRHSLNAAKHETEKAERNFLEYKRQLKQLAGTVEDVISLWIESHKHLKSIGRAKSRKVPILKFFGNCAPDQITRELCREYAEYRLGLTNTSIRNELSLLRAAIKWHNPNTDSVFDLPSPDPPKDHFLSKDEFKRLYFGAGSPHIRLFLILALCTGARSNAILDLEWSQIDLERKRINFIKGDHKNKRRAIVPINDCLEGALRQACTMKTCPYVIEHGGRGIKSVKRGFASAAKKGGVQATPHVLRHTAAVAMAEGGVSTKEIGQFLGHQGQNTTERIYALYSPDYLKGAAQALDEWIFSSLGIRPLPFGEE